MKDLKIQWHSGFVAAMNLELAQNREDLIFEKEFNLNSKSLEVDLLIVKKETNVLVSNEIGNIFKGHNVIEYKSPGDRLDIDVFYKVGAYASLYKSYGKTVDGRKADDITVSMIRESKPEGLFRYFRKHGYGVLNPYRGIYYIEGNVLFPTQIVVTRELDFKTHIWLGALSGSLQKRELEEVLERVRRLAGKEPRELADSVLEVSTRANQPMIEEWIGDDRMCHALMEIMKPHIEVLIKEKAEAELKRGLERGMEQGLEQGLEQGMERGLKQGLERGMEQGLERGLEQGLERGMEQGLERGLEQGRKEGICGTIEVLRRYGHGITEIQEAIMEQYGLSAEQAAEFLK